MTGAGYKGFDMRSSALAVRGGGWFGCTVTQPSFCIHRRYAGVFKGGCFFAYLYSRPSSIFLNLETISVYWKLGNAGFSLK
jgi:hypothetical protein